jgi:hypothetical protein
MTPQEKDLITQLLSRLPSGDEPRDAEAEALIRAAVTQRPDAPYFLVQTVLVQEMALAEAQKRIEDLNQQLAAKPAAPQSQPTSFLGRAFRNAGSAPPNAGPWGAPPSNAPQPSSVWSQSSGGPVPAQGMAPPMMPGVAAPGMPWGGGGFLQQAAMTAAGVAGGALLFQGIQSMFGPHYGNVLGGMPMQPGISETVINNYYDGSAPDTHDAGYTQADSGTSDSQDFADNSGSDFGGDGGSFDV